MNENEAKLRRELEQATARPGRVAEGELSPEGAELRECWLALGQLLDASYRSFDPAKVLDRLESSGRTAETSERLGGGTTTRGGVGWRTLATWAVAASLVGGLAVAAWRWRNDGESPSRQAPIARQETSAERSSRDDSDDPAPRIAEDAPGKNPSPRSEPSQGADPASSVATAADSTGDAATAWDDAFDEQLAATQWRMSQAGATASASEVRYESLRQAVEQFDSELSGSSL